MVFAGGKGANQSIALARAGAAVAHCGKVGPDGVWLIDKLRAEGIDTHWWDRAARRPGRQSSRSPMTAQNGIVLLAGANHEIGADEVESALGQCDRARWCSRKMKRPAWPA